MNYDINLGGNLADPPASTEAESPCMSFRSNPFHPHQFQPKLSLCSKTCPTEPYLRVGNGSSDNSDIMSEELLGNPNNFFENSLKLFVFGNDFIFI